MKEPELVIIVRDPLYRSAIKRILSDIGNTTEPKFKENMSDCLNGLCKPKYLVLDSIVIPDPKNYSLERICTKSPNCKILALNSQLLPNEWHSYLHTKLRDTDTEEAIQSKFKSFLSQSSKSTTPNDNTLSDREVEVVQLVALGKTNKEISESLHISTHTVITHRKNITAKLGIKTIAGLAVYSVLNGLIDPDQVNK